MARRKEITGNTVSFELPSGIPVEIQEIGGHAEKILRNREFLKSGKAVGLFMMDAIVRLNGEPLPDMKSGTLKIHPYREDVPIMLETCGGMAEINYLTGRKERLLANQSDIDPITIAMLACDTFNGEKRRASSLVWRTADA